MLLCFWRKWTILQRKSRTKQSVAVWKKSCTWSPFKPSFRFARRHHKLYEQKDLPTFVGSVGIERRSRNQCWMSYERLKCRTRAVVICNTVSKEKVRVASRSFKMHLLPIRFLATQKRAAVNLWTHNPSADNKIWLWKIQTLRQQIITKAHLTLKWSKEAYGRSGAARWRKYGIFETSTKISRSISIVTIQQNTHRHRYCLVRLRKTI